MAGLIGLEDTGSKPVMPQLKMIIKMFIKLNNILLISINYDKDVSNGSEEYNHHRCMIEKA